MSKELSITELWEELQLFVNGVVGDNRRCEHYDLETRIEQMARIQQLIKLINMKHLRSLDEAKEKIKPSEYIRVDCAMLEEK